MRQKRKRTAAETLRRIAKMNPQVDKKMVEESIAFVEFARSIGFKGRSYDLLRSSESRLKAKSPILSEL
jgi:hypothetical protein